MTKICLVVCRATAGGAVLAVAEQLPGHVTAVGDGRKKSLFLLQSEDDMILLHRSTRAVLIFLFVWVVSLSRSVHHPCHLSALRVSSQRLWLGGPARDPGFPVLALRQGLI